MTDQGQTVKFVVEVDPRSIGRMTEAQIAELGKRVGKLLKPPPAKENSNDRPGMVARRTSGALMGSAMPIAGVAGAALAAATGVGGINRWKLAENVATITEVAAKATGDFLSKMMPQKVKGWLGDLGVDVESLGTDAKAVASQLRQAMDRLQAVEAATAAGQGAVSKLATAAANAGTIGSMSLEHAGKASMVAAAVSFLDAEVRDQRNRRADYRGTQAVIDGMRARFEAGIGLAR